VTGGWRSGLRAKRALIKKRIKAIITFEINIIEGPVNKIWRK